LCHSLFPGIAMAFYLLVIFLGGEVFRLRKAVLEKG
jgi:hypothetical protein